MGNVLRTLLAVTLLVVVVAGCGGAAPAERSAAHGVPRALARQWEGRASAIAAAAAAGNSCRAQQLAASLRDDVVGSEGKLPVRLRSPLLTGVNALADHITCTPVATTPTTTGKPKPPPKERPKPPERHRPPGHHKKHDKGHEG
jgi:hypothetical protein